MIMAVFYVVTFVFVATALIFIYKIVKKVKKRSINKEKVKKQLDFTTRYLENLIFDLPIPSLINGYKTLYIMEAIVNMFAKWIVSNEISLDEHNVFNKQLQVFNFVDSMTSLQEYKNENFKNFCYEHIKKLFEELNNF